MMGWNETWRQTSGEHLGKMYKQGQILVEIVGDVEKI
jgi:hypothetical protein